MTAENKFHKIKDEEYTLSQKKALAIGLYKYIQEVDISLGEFSQATNITLEEALCIKNMELSQVSLSHLGKCYVKMGLQKKMEGIILRDKKAQDLIPLNKCFNHLKFAIKNKNHRELRRAWDSLLMVKRYSHEDDETVSQLVEAFLVMMIGFEIDSYNPYQDKVNMLGWNALSKDIDKISDLDNSASMKDVLQSIQRLQSYQDVQKNPYKKEKEELSEESELMRLSINFLN